MCVYIYMGTVLQLSWNYRYLKLTIYTGREGGGSLLVVPVCLLLSKCHAGEQKEEDAQLMCYCSSYTKAIPEILYVYMFLCVIIISPE